jgi:hypothetical protein
LYIQVRYISGSESFIEEERLESSIAAGDIVAFRRSDGWINVPLASHRGKLQIRKSAYSGQERRRSVLSKKRIFPDVE